MALVASVTEQFALCTEVIMVHSFRLRLWFSLSVFLFSFGVSSHCLAQLPVIAIPIELFNDTDTENLSFAGEASVLVGNNLIVGASTGGNNSSYSDQVK